MSIKKHMIVAPHADDEIIGCFSILKHGSVKTVAFPSWNPNAIEEAWRMKAAFHVGLVGFNDVVLPTLVNSVDREGGLVFFPHPVFEYHPQHRILGAIGENILKSGYKNIVFYTTNMNAPFMREVPDPEEKRVALDVCYEEKSSLWKYDHKYFLFEGYDMWSIHPTLL